MRLRALEDSLRESAARAFGLAREQLASLAVAPPPGHIDADASVSWPISAAKELRKPPLKIAEELRAALPPELSAGAVPPGFVNLKLADGFLLDSLRDITEVPSYFHRPEYSAEHINLEFVSANPTGPLHLASGRGATLGDSLARIFRALGARVSEEFYVNDKGRQVEMLGLSLKARFEGNDPPEDGYHGDYLKELAAGLPREASSWDAAKFSGYAITEMLRLHRADMAEFRVEFDRWFLESELHAAEAPAKALAELRRRGMAYDKENAVWFGPSQSSGHRPRTMPPCSGAASELESDDKDRVLVKSGGANTYFLNDIAYHLDKLSRGFTRLIDVWGADHHGYVPRMEAAVGALSGAAEKFKVVIHQQVALKRGAELVKMSKRAGEFISLKELVDEVGADACRFFFASRGPNTHLTFDVDLAKKRSNENPVFYVQYVHARISSIFANAAEKGVDPAAGFDRAAVKFNPEERALAMKLLWLEKVLSDCARDYSPHHLTTYLVELASLFHSFYDKHKVLDPQSPQVTAFRLFLLRAVRKVIADTLGLLGVSAPERM